jgi:hypothetical protein
MDIGQPQRTYTVEPLEDPAPQRRPAERDEPAEPEAEPVTPEPDSVPAGV